MPEGKSKHPGLVKTASDTFSRMSKGLAKTYPTLKELSAAAAALRAAADEADKAFRDQESFCGKLIERYTEKANEIAEIELDLEEAKGDKKAEAPLLKKHKKADGEADDIRKEYGEAVEVFRTLSETVEEAASRIADAVAKFSAAKTG